MMRQDEVSCFGVVFCLLIALVVFSEILQVSIFIT